MDNETGRPGYKVMLIDDTEVDAFISKRMLTNSNFSSEIMEFYSAEKALDFLIENRENTEVLPQVIFLDIHMPAMDGFDFLDKFSSEMGEAGEFCKVVMLSSSNDEKDLSQLKKYTNVLKHLTKPLKKEELRELDLAIHATIR